MFSCIILVTASDCVYNILIVQLLCIVCKANEANSYTWNRHEEWNQTGKEHANMLVSLINNSILKGNN